MAKDLKDKKLSSLIDLMITEHGQIVALEKRIDSQLSKGSQVYEDATSHLSASKIFYETIKAEIDRREKLYVGKQ